MSSKTTKITDTTESKFKKYVNESRKQIGSKVVLDVINTNLNLKTSKSNHEYRIRKYFRNTSRPVDIRFLSKYFKNVIYNNKRMVKNIGMVLRE